LSAARRISPRLRCGPSPAFGQSVASGRYTVGMAGNVVHQLLATDMALDKLGARAISAEAVSPKAFMIQRQPRRANLGRRRPTRRGSIPRRSSWPFARGVHARRAHDVRQRRAAVLIESPAAMGGSATALPPRPGEASFWTAPAQTMTPRPLGASAAARWRLSEQRIPMCDIVGGWTPSGAISSITPPRARLRLSLRACPKPGSG
jgi:hypothetical protein